MFRLSWLLVVFLVGAIQESAQQTCLPLSMAGGIELFSKNYQLQFSDGTEYKLKGLNWFGFETSLYVVHGLWAQSIDYFLDFCVEHKFNALRIPLSVDAVLTDPKPPVYDHLSCFFDGEITSLQALDYLIARLAERGILLLLDQHRLNTGSISPCYTDDQHPEDMIVEFWDTIVARYKDSWNVIGVDLKNEPYECEWRDWVDFATRMSNHILQQVPRWLMFVNGIGSNVNDEDRQCFACTEGTFWGENLMGVCNYAVEFNTTAKQEKLVYSPHVYGPSVYRQEYFDDPDFPNNMPDIWNCHFGFLHNSSAYNEHENAVVVGEWGGEYTDSKRKMDKTWQDAYKQWSYDNQLPGSFYWCLNKNSGDTGGLLTGQKWQTPETEKLALLESLYSNPTVITSNSTHYCFQDWSTLQTYDPWSCSPVTEPTSSPMTGGCDPNDVGCLNAGKLRGNCDPDLCCSCECTKGNPANRECA